MKKILNKPYSENFKKQRVVDFYIPDNPVSDKCLFFIHGGGFHSGKKVAWQPVAEWFCEKGYICANMEYRLAPKNIEIKENRVYKQDETEDTWYFPAQIEDVRLCMSYLKQNSNKYGFDKNKVIVIGSSAGAHLCGMLMTIEENDLLGYTPEMTTLDTMPMAGVLYCPVVDLHYNDTTIYGCDTTFCQSFLGKTIENNGILYKLASPVYRINKNSSPCLVIHAKNDQLVTEKAINNLMDGFKQNSVPVKLVNVKGAKHGFGYNTKTEQQIFAVEKMHEYVQEL